MGIRLGGGLSMRGSGVRLLVLLVPWSAGCWRAGQEEVVVYAALDQEFAEGPACSIRACSRRILILNRLGAAGVGAQPLTAAMYSSAVSK
jgi:hypothetical protein